MTIRDVDCENFDVEQMLLDYRELGVTFFTFFSGGYVTTYPSKLQYQRQSPFLNGRDLTGEIIETAHRYGIKAIPMIDLSVLPKFAGDAHPEWCSVDSNGDPYYSAESETYTACIMGGYQNEYAKEIVREIMSRYDVDGMKFGGTSYGFHGSICHCERCQQDYFNIYQESIPNAKDWESPAWRRFYEWRLAKTSQRVKDLQIMVSSIRHGVPVMGNACCFGHEEWTTRASLDVEEMAKHQDMVQIEAQDKMRMGNDLTTSWQYFLWPTEESVYMTSVSDKPIWIVVPYFLAWPWRRTAMPYADQKAYMAQIIANGASPMINLSGGPPKVHDDKRGFAAPKEIFHFLRNHVAYYEQDYSRAEIAIVYSQETLIYYGKNDPLNRYVDYIRGIERALQESQNPFDIISAKALSPQLLSKYKTVILPNFACMDKTTGVLLRQYVESGGNLVATYESSLYDMQGTRREDFLLADLLGVSYQGDRYINGDGKRSKWQNYMRPVERLSLLDGLEETELIAISGKYCAVHVANTADINVPMILDAPFKVFPEGMSYTLDPRLDDPMVITREHSSGGRIVYFPNEIDRCFYRTGLPDLAQIISNTVTWVRNGASRLRVEGAPSTLAVSHRAQENRAMIHLVNITGGQRLFRQLIPLNGIRIGLHMDECTNDVKVFLLSSQESLEIHEKEGYLWVTVPCLHDYDVVVFENE